MAPEVGDDVGPAGDGWIEPPGIIRIVEKPILEKMSEEGPDLSESPDAGASRRFLDDGIVAVTEIDGRERTVPAGETDELRGLPGIERKRFFGNDVVGCEVGNDGQHRRDEHRENDVFVFEKAHGGRYNNSNRKPVRTAGEPGLFAAEAAPTE